VASSRAAACRNAASVSASTAEHWVHIRITNPIEWIFSTVRLRTKRLRNCGSRETTPAMVYQLLQSAQKRWKRIKGFKTILEKRIRGRRHLVLILREDGS
jgi:Transposase, Mutator family.